MKSVYAQSPIPEKVVIINDGSNCKITDAALRRLEIDFADDKTFLIVTLPTNFGVSTARNVGINHVYSEYLAFLDADDFWDKDKISLISNSVKNLDANTPMLAHNISLKYQEKKKNLPAHATGYKISYTQILFKNSIATSSVIIRAKEILSFDESMEYSEDYDLWLRILQNNKKCYYVEQSLGYRSRKVGSKGGLSHNHKKMHLGALRALNKQLRNADRLTFKRVFIIAALLFETLKYFRRLLLWSYRNQI